jgi:hypothetical protein
LLLLRQSLRLFGSGTLLAFLSVSILVRMPAQAHPLTEDDDMSTKVPTSRRPLVFASLLAVLLLAIIVPTVHAPLKVGTSGSYRVSPATQAILWPGLPDHPGPAAERFTPSSKGGRA